MTAAATPPTLDYGSPLPQRLWRWGKRLFVLGWVALTLYLGYQQWGVRARLQVELLRTQRRYLGFTQPAGQVVFENDPSRMTALRELPGYRGGSRTTWGPPYTSPDLVAVATGGGSRLQEFEHAWDRIRKLETLRHLKDPDDLTPPHTSGIFGGLPDDEVTVFMQSRQVAGKPERLVVVNALWRAGSEDTNASETDRLDSIGFDVRVLAPASWTGVPQELSAAVHVTGDGAGTVEIRPVTPGSLLRVFAAQPNPANAGRFVIEYETAAGRSEIDGRLLGDDTIELKVRSGPALNPLRTPSAGR